MDALVSERLGRAKRPGKDFYQRLFFSLDHVTRRFLSDLYVAQIKEMNSLMCASSRGQASTGREVQSCTVMGPTLDHK